MQDTANALIESNSAHTDVVTEALDSMFDYGIEFERERIIKLLEAHQSTGESVSGFLMMCACGAAVDDFREHLAELIKGENK
jgi:hypothetical protein